MRTDCQLQDGQAPGARGLQQLPAILPMDRTAHCTPHMNPLDTLPQSAPYCPLWIIPATSDLSWLPSVPYYPTYSSAQPHPVTPHHPLHTTLSPTLPPSLHLWIQFSLNQLISHHDPAPTISLTESFPNLLTSQNSLQFFAHLDLP